MDTNEMAIRETMSEVQNKWERLTDTVEAALEHDNLTDDERNQIKKESADLINTLDEFDEREIDAIRSKMSKTKTFLVASALLAVSPLFVPDSVKESNSETASKITHFMPLLGLGALACTSINALSTKRRLDCSYQMSASIRGTVNNIYERVLNERCDL